MVEGAILYKLPYFGSSKIFVTRVFWRLRNHTFDGHISGLEQDRQSETTFAHKVDYALSIAAIAVNVIGVIEGARGEFVEFLRFFQSLAFHSHVCLRVLNKPTRNIHTTGAPL